MRYLKIKKYDGPDVTRAYVSTEYGDFDADIIEYSGKDLMIGFNLKEAIILKTLYLYGSDGRFSIDVSHCRGGSSDFSTIYNGPSYKKKEKNGCLIFLWKVIKFIFIVLLILIVLALIFGN